MAIHCPNKSSENWKALEKRVGTVAAYSIWNKADGRISINGFPLKSAMVMMNLSELNIIQKSRFDEAVEKYEITTL